MSSNTDIHWILIHSFYFFFTFLKGFFNKCVCNFDGMNEMFPKMATLGLLKVKVFCSKGCDVIILSCGSNYMVDVAFDQSLVTIAFLREKLS